MKITQIECIPLSLPRKMKGEKARPGDILLVKIHTDEGITGIGDGGGVNQEAVVMMIKSWESFLIGANPLDRGPIYAKMSRAIGSTWGISYPAAVTTMDFALWDLAGKAYNQPVYQLLGGKQVEKLRYNYFISSETAPTAKDRAKEAEEAVAGGVTSLGLKAEGFGGGVHSVEKDIENTMAVKKAVGDKVEISYDANAAFNYYEALKLGRALDDIGLYKFEQPNPAWDIDGLVALRAHLKTPICAHESTVLIPGLMEVIKRKAADIVGTKLASAGGITAGIQWANIAKASALGMYCGSMNGPWEAAAQAHWLCSEAEFGKQAQAVFSPVIMYGTFDTTRSVDVDIIKNPMKYKNGYFWPPEGPGLGLELNDEAMPKYITKGKSIVTIGDKKLVTARAR
jgi:L-alanine-DL-glutamate epimerase-like enolase superfamily enzyme